MPNGLRRHLLVSRRPSFEATGRLLLLALALDRPAGHPDNVAATAKILASSEQAVRNWRRSLLADGLLVRRAGFLLGGPGLPAWTNRARADFEARGLRYGHDPVPRRFVAVAGNPATVHAAAVVYADALGFERDRRFVRTDAERAALANVSRPTVRAARAQLEETGLVLVEELQRGRAGLRRVSLRAGGRATHGAPMSERRAAALAAAGERQRAAAASALVSGFAPSNEAPPTPQPVASVTPQPVASLHQVPSVQATMRDGGPSDRHGGIAARRLDGAKPAEVRSRCATFFGNRQTVERFLVMATRRPEHATRELLAMAGCFDGSRRRATSWPAALVQRWRGEAPLLLLGIVADVVAGVGRNHAASIGAVVAARLPRLLAGKATDALSHRMRGRSVADILAAAATRGSIARTG